MSGHKRAFKDRILRPCCAIFYWEGVKCLDWVQSIQRALSYIEAHLLDETPDNDSVARQAYSSNANFLRIFSVSCGANNE